MRGASPGAAGTVTRTWGAEGGSYSADGRYRWFYARHLRPGGTGGTICWIGLNPGTGDTEGRYRPTLQRMVDRSLALGMGRFVLVNLFAWRATRPADLRAAARSEDVVGALNDAAVQAAAAGAARVVAAWGSHGSLLGRDAAVRAMLGPLCCLGWTAKGHPRHPLHVGRQHELRPLLPRQVT